MSLFITLILAVSLSMDAFSLALIYGTLNLDKKMIKLMSIMVGIFHFFMPIFGYKIGEFLLNIIKVEPDILVGIIFIVLGIEMILSIKQEEKVKILTGIISVLLFSFTVSIDSFSVGISLGVTNSSIILPCLIFSLISGIFTYLGVNLGKRLSNKFGSVTTLIGAITLLILGIKYLV